MRQLKIGTGITEQQQLLVILPTPENEVRTLAVPSSATLQAAANVLQENVLHDAERPSVVASRVEVSWWTTASQTI